MFESKRSLVASVVAVTISGVLLVATSSAKPPKPDTGADRVTREDLGFSYVLPAEYRTDPVEFRGIVPKLALRGPSTNQVTSVSDSENHTTNHKLATEIFLFVEPRLPGDVDVDEVAPATKAKEVLDAYTRGLRSNGVMLNYQNSALVDVSSHPALAILAESSLRTVADDRAMVRFIIFNHRDKRYTFIFEANDTEFETRVTAFEAFIHSLKFLEPNIRPTPSPNKPVNIKIGQ